MAIEFCLNNQIYVEIINAVEKEISVTTKEKYVSTKNGREMKPAKTSLLR